MALYYFTIRNKQLLNHNGSAKMFVLGHVKCDISKIPSKLQYVKATNKKI